VIARWLIIASLLPLAAFAQSNQPAAHINLAGTFNDWSPTNANYRMSPISNGVYGLTRYFDAGQYQFKFTFDGSWTKHLGAGRRGTLEQPGREIDSTSKGPATITSNWTSTRSDGSLTKFPLQLRTQSSPYAARLS